MLSMPGLKSLAKNLVLYGIIGCVAAGADTLLFLILTNATSLNYLYANAISVVVGILISFTLNRRYNFKVMDHPVRRGLIFFSVGLVGLFISQLLLWAGTYAGFAPVDTKIVSVVIVAIAQFTLNKLLSFGLKFNSGSLDNE